MEQIDTVQSTPMGRVWFMVILSMLCIFAVSWSLHIYGMAKQQERFSRNDVEIKERLVKLNQYRDILKEKGKGGAKEYLDGLTRQSYGQ